MNKTVLGFVIAHVVLCLPPSCVALEKGTRTRREGDRNEENRRVYSKCNIRRTDIRLLRKKVA